MSGVCTYSAQTVTHNFTKYYFGDNVTVFGSFYQKRSSQLRLSRLTDNGHDDLAMAGMATPKPSTHGHSPTRTALYLSKVWSGQSACCFGTTVAFVLLCTWLFQPGGGGWVAMWWWQLVIMVGVMAVLPHLTALLTATKKPCSGDQDLCPSRSPPSPSSPFSRKKAATSVVTLDNDGHELVRCLERLKELTGNHANFHRHDNRARLEGAFLEVSRRSEAPFPPSRLQRHSRDTIARLDPPDAPRPRCHGPRGAGGNLGHPWPHWRIGAGNTGGPDDDGSTNVGRQVGRAWAAAVAAQVEKASEAVKRTGGDWTVKVLFPRGCKEAFGNALDIVKPNRSNRRDPCPRLFVHGRCRQPRCFCSHGLEREPSSAQTRQFTDWVKRRCSKLVEEPAIS